SSCHPRFSPSISFTSGTRASNNRFNTGASLRLLWYERSMQGSRLVLAGLIAFAIGIATWLSFRSLPKFKPRPAQLENASAISNSPDAGTQAASARASAPKPVTPKPALQSLDDAPKYDGPVRDRERADQLRGLLAVLHAGQLD